MCRSLGCGLVAGIVLCGCVSAPPAPPTPGSAPIVRGTPPPTSSPAPAPSAAEPRYRCDDGTEFSVRFAPDTALVQRGSRGSEELLRDAGGVTPLQTVYSSTRMRAEFGLGSDGREAKLRLLQDQKVLLCTRV